MVVRDGNESGVESGVESEMKDRSQQQTTTIQKQQRTDWEGAKAEADTAKRDNTTTCIILFYVFCCSNIFDIQERERELQPQQHRNRTAIAGVSIHAPWRRVG